MKGPPAMGFARAGERKLCLEDYLDFCDHDLHRPDFIIHQLNHIIFMHGFIRMHRGHKGEIKSALDAMELMPAARSTLGESISGCAPLAVEEVSRDLDAIGWQECPLGSVRSVGVPRGAAEDAVTDASPVCCSGTAAAASAGQLQGQVQKKARKRKRGRALAVPLLTMAPTGEASG